jgi:hypothetical protein
MANIRNAQLLQRVTAHPLKSTLAKSLDIAENFAGDVEFLRLDRNLSAEGRANERSKKLRAAIRDLRDARAPVEALEKKLEQKKAALAIPAFKQDDVVGFLRRQELRQTLRTMDTGQRELALNDPAFADAMLETAPLVSGLFLAEDFKGTVSAEIQRDRDIVAAAKEKRLAGMFGPQLAEIDALAETIAEARAITGVAYNDVRAESGMQEHVFNEFCKPIEARQNAPWLKKYTENGVEVIRVVDLENHAARIATEREILDGKYYQSHQEYLADRSAA